MTEEVLNEGAPAPATDDLRSVISSAIASQRNEAVDTVKSEPTAETAEETEAKAARAREANGRFAKGAEASPANEQDIPKVEAEAAPEPAADPAKSASDIRPPPGFSVASKAAWDQLPAEVKQDIAKREAEMDAGMKRYAGLGKYAEVAERNGRTLSVAMQDYHKMEESLRGDFIGGIEDVCKWFGVDPRSLSMAMQGRYGGSADQRQTPATQANPDQGRQQPQIDPSAIERKILDRIRSEQNDRELNSQLVAFSSDPKNRFYENVRTDMAALIQAGKATTLQDAYDAACWLNPETRKIMLREQAPPAQQLQKASAVDQAKAASKAVGGAPAPGFKPAASEINANLSTRDVIKASIAAQRGAA